MASFLFISSHLCIVALLFTTTLTHTVTSRDLNTPNAKVTNLHFWFQELRTGTNITRINVVKSNFTSGFGAINVFDNLLTTGADLGSEFIGRAQGIDSTASVGGTSGWTSLNFIFTGGEFNGSSLTVLGSFGFTGVSEMSVVGGTRKFRMAQGYLHNAVQPTSYGLKAEFNVTVFTIPIKS